MSRSGWVALVSGAVAATACSAPAGGDDDDLPGFTGGPAGSAGSGGSAGGSAPGAGGSVQSTGGTGGSQNTGGTGGSQNTGGTSTTPAGGTGGGGTGGSQNAGGASGAAGSSMGQGGSANEPGGLSCGGATLFCEDFEGLALGALQAGGALTPERTVSVVAEAGRGQVLQVTAGPGYGAKAGVFLNTFTPPNNAYFGRMFVRVGQFPTADGDHWVLVEATGAGSQEQVRPVGGQFQRWAPGADGPSAGDWTDWQQSNAATVAGQWECVEWQMNGANGGNDITLWVNDQQVTPTDRGNFAFPTVNRLWFGWVVYQMGQPNQYDVRLDDIVLSSERVGCD